MKIVKIIECFYLITNIQNRSKRDDILIQLNNYLASLPFLYRIVYPIVELVVIDYILEILGIDIQKRLEYKNFYLKRAFSFVIN